MVTLKEINEIIKEIIKNDINEELEIYVESCPKPHFVIKEKKVIII